MKTPPKRHFRFEHRGHLITASVSATEITFRPFRSRRTRSITLTDAFEAAHGQKLLPLS